MQKVIPTINAELIATANDFSIAANAHESTVPLLQNTKDDIDADIQPLVDAIMAHGLGKAELKMRRNTTRTLLTSSRALLMFGRDSFKLDFGNEFTDSWTALGHNGSLEIQDNEVAVLQFLLNYKNHLTVNPGAEIPVKNFTAAHLGVLHAQLTAARGAVNLQETVAGSLMATRD
ncbi:MAG: hypothetical protein JWM68_4714, partial [Verrucomicrobiales bacterium]|nr:hypothetical protein [Verrucomicrobiales bacterium]